MKDFLYKFEQSLFSIPSQATTEINKKLDLLSSLILTADAEDVTTFKQLLRLFIVICQLFVLTKPQQDKIFINFIHVFGYDYLNILNICKNNGYFIKSSLISNSILSSNSSIYSKLSESLCYPGWSSIQSTLDQLSGPTLHLNRISCENSKPVRNVVILCLGGIRLFEINQMKKIAEKSFQPKIKFYFITTSLLNSGSLLDGIVR